MRNYKIILAGLTFGFLGLIQPALAKDVPTIGLGVTLSGGGWNGDNGESDSTFESDKGGQFGFNASYRLDQLYIGLSIQSGEYQFLKTAPTQFTSNGSLAVNNSKVEHSDFDLVFGYYFWPRVSLFVDLKSATSHWLENGYKQNFGGIGFGASSFHVIDSEFTLFASVGLVNGEIGDDNNVTNGEGQSRSLTLGAVKRFDANNTMSFGFKTRRYLFDFDAGDSQDYRLNSLFVGYQHSLEW